MALRERKDGDVNVDTSELDALFEGLTNEEARKAMFAVLTKAGNKVRKAGNVAFRPLISNPHGHTRTPRKGRLIGSVDKKGRKRTPVGIKLNRKPRDGKDPYAIVGLRVGRADFRSVFFEKGTKVRYTKKGYLRGRVHGGSYFRRTTDRLERQVMSEMEQDAIKVITTIKRRKAKRAANAAGKA